MDKENDILPNTIQVLKKKKKKVPHIICKEKYYKENCQNDFMVTPSKEQGLLLDQQ